MAPKAFACFVQIFIVFLCIFEGECGQCNGTCTDKDECLGSSGVEDCACNTDRDTYKCHSCVAGTWTCNPDTDAEEMDYCAQRCNDPSFFCSRRTNTCFSLTMV